MISTILKDPNFLLCLHTIRNILMVLIPVILGAAYMSYGDRKIIGYMQYRIGPSKLGPFGLIQPIADAIKLLLKEFIIPQKSKKFLFLLAPMLSIAPAVMAWAVIPFSKGMCISNINNSLSYVLAVTSIGVYGIIMAGWASQSKYAFLGALRAAAQMVSYEMSMGLALVSVILVSGSLNLTDIVQAQQVGWARSYLGLNILSWNLIPLFPMAITYFICGLAETNRVPFDMAESEADLVAGFHVEYSAMGFALFFLSEYANIILISAMTTLLFLGGWDAPISLLNFMPGLFWFGTKVSFLLFVFIWVRATLPRYRYDQIMYLGWKVFLPITLSYLILLSIWIMSPMNLWN